MRRMRDLFWFIFIFAVPAVVAALGIQYFVSPVGPNSENSDKVAIVKPSHFQAHSGVVLEKGSLPRGDALEVVIVKRPLVGKRAVPVIPEGPKDEVEEVEEEEAANEGVPISRVVAANPKLEKTAPLSACTSVEYAGKPANAIVIPDKEWAVVMAYFHDAKRSLTAWIRRSGKNLPEKTREMFEKRVAILKIQRPPISEEPDLSWRGIGHLVQEPGMKDPIVRLGGGFLELVKQKPTRAKFELTRLVAQAWAPCELKEVAPWTVWNPLLACLGVQEEKACESGSFSEGGWAVATVLATSLFPPDCEVGAFKEEKMAACLKLPVPFEWRNPHAFLEKVR